MARVLGKSVTVAPALSFERPVTVSDILAAAQAHPEAVTVLVDDSEPTPRTCDDLEEVLARDAEEKPGVAEVCLDAVVALEPDARQDESERRVRAVLAALEGLGKSDDPDAKAWVAERIKK